MSYHVKVQGLLPYYIALDRTRQCVVLSVRGSLSLSDVVTDLMAHPVPLLLPQGGWLTEVRARVCFTECARMCSLKHCT